MRVGEGEVRMVGELVMDRFRLQERIGSGGMGTVYKAFDERLQRHVAVKEVMAGDPARVVREAQAAARLNHPGIVTLFELGIDGHRALLVSELVSGTTLDELVRDGDLCDRDVGELGADVCEALEHAHERGVVHRDVKPQNVIASGADGAGKRAKLMDFGIASLIGSPTLTATGEVVGTLAYMSPEQAEGAPAEEASDTYSLALTLYECWAGENPVRRATPAQTARELGSPLPPLGAYRPDLPSDLSLAVDACLRADPELRAPLADLAHALERTIPELDDTYALPTPESDAASDPGVLRLSAARLAPALALVALCVLLAAPAGLPGLALVTATLCLPALLFATSPGRLALPGLSIVLGALSLGAAYPAAVAASERTPLSRFAMGVIGWAWLLGACAALGIAPPADLMEPPPANWDASVATASSALLVPLTEPASLLGFAVFGLGATTLGRIIEARHLAMAVVGSLLWAAALAAAMRFVGDGGLDWAPAVIVASALLALASRRGYRPPRPRLRGFTAPGRVPAHH